MPARIHRHESLSGQRTEGRVGEMSELKEASKFLSRPGPEEPYDSGASTVLATFLAMLWRRRVVVLGTLMVTVLAGLLFALLVPPKYFFVSSIEIGAILKDGKRELVENTEMARAKILNSYLPFLRARSADEEGGGPGVYETMVLTRPKMADILVLTSIGKLPDSAEHMRAHKELVGMVTEDHHKTLEPMRNSISIRIKQAGVRLAALEDPSRLKLEESRLNLLVKKAEEELAMLADPRIPASQVRELETKIEGQGSRLEALADQAEVIKRRLELLTEKRSLLEEQAAELKKEIAAAAEQRGEAALDVEDEPAAMTLLMLDSQTARNIRRLEEIDLELRVTIWEDQMRLENALEELELDKKVQALRIREAESSLERFTTVNKLNQEALRARVVEAKASREATLADLETEIAAQRLVVEELELSLAGIRDTRLVTPTWRSANPARGSTRQLLSLCAVLGLVLGIIFAYFSENLARARRYLRPAREPQELS